MEKGEIHGTVALETDSQAAEAVKPGKKAFDLPAVRGDFRMGMRAVATPLAGCRAAYGDAVADAAPGQAAAKQTAVIASVGGQRRGAATRPTVAPRHADGLQGRHCGAQFMHIPGLQVQSQRHAVSTGHDMAFAGHPRPRAPGFAAPFFAFT